jgi:hypothetical protein
MRRVIEKLYRRLLFKRYYYQLKLDYVKTVLKSRVLSAYKH